jgi:hypothetical protein
LTLTTALLWGRRAFNRHGHNGLTAHQDEAQWSLQYTFSIGFSLALALAGIGLAELFGIADDQVHVLVKGHELTDHFSTVLNGHTNAVVDPLLHLACLGHCHF